MNNNPVELFEISTWNKNFETGIPLIDQQHRQLLSILNQLAAHLGKQSDAVQLNRVFAELTAYADYHFKTEEGIWQPYFRDDPWYAEHQLVHKSFMSRVLNLKQAEKTRPLDQVVEEILRFLTHWLAEHILDSDKRMAKVVQAIDSGLSMEQAKQRAEREMSGSMKVMIETVLSMHDHLSSRTFELMREKAATREMEKALKTSGQREKVFSDTVMSSVPGLLYLFDERLRLIRWNTRFSELTGYTPEDLSTMQLLDFFEEKYHPKIRKIAASFYHGDYSEVEGTLLAKNGERISFLFTSVPLLIDGKRYFIGVGVDISRRKMAEKRLRMLSSSVEQANESILIADLKGAIKYVNPAFTRLTGYTEDDILGENPRILNSGKQDDLFYKEMWKTISAGNAWQGRVVDRKKDGSLYPAMLTISPVRNRAGEIESYVGIQQDLSAFENLEQQFHQAQKMEAIGTLVGGIAHDFNNMLAGILGNLYLLKLRVKDMPDVMQKLSGIEQLSFRAADMIQQLLTFARKDQISMKPFPLAPFIKETVKFLRTSVPEDIEIRQDICKETLTVNGDSTQLHQVLLNLINNARDAVEGVPEPRIYIRLEPFQADEAFRTAHPYFPRGRYVHLSVTDNGCGIPGKHLEHLFEPFFTSKEQGKGTGLGLAMVFGAIKSHHGYVEAESIEGQGATFHVYLPLLDQQSPASAFSQQDEAIAEGSNELILLVDDDPQVIEIGKELLESIGYRVLTASNGLQAVDVFEANRDDISLIMMDVVMPSLGGVKAMERIRKTRPDIKVIFCTGYDRNASIPRNIPDGATVLSKPYKMAELSNIIRNQLGT